MELTQEQKLYAEIVEKAWNDADFKKALVENPAAAIESFTGKKLNLPEGKTLVVRDQTDESKVYINIPSVSEFDTELSERELEAVSGGTCVFPTIITMGPWIVPTLPGEDMQVIK